MTCACKARVLKAQLGCPRYLTCMLAGFENAAPPTSATPRENRMAAPTIPVLPAPSATSTAPTFNLNPSGNGQQPGEMPKE